MLHSFKIKKKFSKYTGVILRSKWNLAPKGLREIG